MSADWGKTYQKLVDAQLKANADAIDEGKKKKRNVYTGWGGLNWLQDEGGSSDGGSDGGGN